MLGAGRKVRPTFLSRPCTMALMARRTAARLLTAVWAVSWLACAAPPASISRSAPAISKTAAIPADTTALLEDLERRSFHFFWDLADPHTLLVPDRAPTPSFSSIAAVGFGLNAYGIGAERGYVTREAAAARTLATLRSLLAMRQ